MSATDTTALAPAAPAPDRGETVIDPRVLATVARRAASEVAGVEVVDDSGLFSRQAATADVAGHHTAVELRLAVSWPHLVVDVTTRVRQRVRDQVRALTGYEVTDVDITVDRLPEPGRPRRRVE